MGRGGGLGDSPYPSLEEGRKGVNGGRDLVRSLHYVIIGGFWIDSGVHEKRGNIWSPNIPEEWLNLGGQKPSLENGRGAVVRKYGRCGKIHLLWKINSRSVREEGKKKHTRRQTEEGAALWAPGRRVRSPSEKKKGGEVWSYRVIVRNGLETAPCPKKNGPAHPCPEEGGLWIIGRGKEGEGAETCACHHGVVLYALWKLGNNRKRWTEEQTSGA